MVARALDYETVKEYIITVEARDGGTPSLSSTAVVKILVVDANDNRPVFARSNYTAVVREDVAVDTSLLQVCQLCLLLYFTSLRCMQCTHDVQFCIIKRLTLRSIVTIGLGCTVWPQCTRVTTNDQPTND